MKINSSRNYNVSTTMSLGFLAWLGGAVHTANLPGYGFWDGLVWMYYVGRYIAMHFGAGA